MDFRTRIDQFRMAIQNFADRSQVAIAHRVDKLRPHVVQRIYIRLELAPAWKSVVARDQELRLGESRRGTLRTHGLEALFGFVFQVLEIGADRKFACRIDGTMGSAAHETFLP